MAKFWEEFDKILLFLLFVALLTILLLLQGAEPETQQWLRESASGVLGALIGIVTGKMLASRASASLDPPKQ